MDPYAKPDERKVGRRRPKISHLPPDAVTRPRGQRHADKEQVAAERRAIKKAARRDLKKQMMEDLNETKSRRM